MAAPNYQASDFLTALQSLMPRGLAWPKDTAAVMAKSMSGLAPMWARHTLQNNNLLVDAFPSTTLQLLPEWESALGLPDPCAGESPTIQQRRAQVVARFTNGGGQSLPYFVQFAASHGYDVSIQEFAPARAGQTRCGSPDYGEAWAFAWAIELPLATVVYARAGLSTAGEPLASWGNAVLQCEMARISPAHTILLFQYEVQIYDNSIVDDFEDPVLTDTGFPIII
jgi:uncharacterized protein YmfQ (DUF2313 family)